MAKITDVELETLLFAEQAADPATPVAGTWRLFFKAGGLYAIDDAGVVVGPFGAGGGGGATNLDGLTDVDTTTVAPVGGDTLVFNGTSGLWEPAAPSGGSTLIKHVGTSTMGEGTYHTVDHPFGHNQFVFRIFDKMNLEDVTRLCTNIYIYAGASNYIEFNFPYSSLPENVQVTMIG